MANKGNTQVESIYAGHFKKVYTFFYYKSFRQDIAEDLTSQTFLIFVEKCADPDADIKDPEKFLYGVMRKVWLRYLQEKYYKNEALIEHMDDFQTHVDATVDKEENCPDRQRVERYVSKLPPKQQAVMRLRLIEQRTLSEICQTLGKNMAYVKTTQRRGIQSLKLLLEEADLETRSNT